MKISARLLIHLRNVHLVIIRQVGFLCQDPGIMRLLKDEEGAHSVPYQGGRAHNGGVRFLQAGNVDIHLGLVNR